MKIYYFIDESGDLNFPQKNEERFFIMSCCVTDTPILIEEKLNALKTEIQNDLYFYKEMPRFEKEGFHATANSFDIRAKYYSLLSRLNVRIYYIIVDKKDPKFEALKKRGVAYYEILYALLADRLEDNRAHENYLCFEECGAKKHRHEKNINDVIDRIKARIKDKHDIEVRALSEVRTKKDILLSLSDYSNFVLWQMLQEETLPNMETKFKLLEPRIALVNNLFKKDFYDQVKRINFEEIKS